MYYPIDIYFRRLMDSLEKVIAPRIEDEFTLGQVYAVIEMLEQIKGKVEYKRDLIREDVERGEEIMEKISQALSGAGAAVPPEIEEVEKEIREKGALPDLALRKKVEQAACKAIDAAHSAREDLGPEASAGLDSEIRRYLVKVSTRDLGLMKPPRLAKISRPKES